MHIYFKSGWYVLFTTTIYTYLRIKYSQEKNFNVTIFEPIRNLVTANKIVFTSNESIIA